MGQLSDKKKKTEAVSRLIRSKARKFLPGWVFDLFNKLMFLFEKIIEPLPSKHWIQDVLVSMPRILVGLSLPFFLIDYQPKEMNEIYTEAGTFIMEYSDAFDENTNFAYVLGLMSYLFDGLFYAFGLNTRMLSVLLLWTSSKLFVISDSVLQLQWVLLWFTLLMTLVFGSGKFGVDYWLLRIPWLKKYLS